MRSQSARQPRISGANSDLSLRAYTSRLSGHSGRKTSRSQISTSRISHRTLASTSRSSRSLSTRRTPRRRPLRHRPAGYIHPTTISQAPTKINRERNAKEDFPIKKEFDFPIKKEFDINSIRRQFDLPPSVEAQPNATGSITLPNTPSNNKLNELLDEALDRGIDIESIKVIKMNVLTGRFSAEHYIEMWTNRLIEMKDESNEDTKSAHTGDVPDKINPGGLAGLAITAKKQPKQVGGKESRDNLYKRLARKTQDGDIRRYFPVSPEVVSILNRLPSHQTALIQTRERLNAPPIEEAVEEIFEPSKISGYFTNRFLPDASSIPTKTLDIYEMPSGKVKQTLMNIKTQANDWMINLSHINVHGCRLTQIDAVYLAEMLATNRTINFVDVSHNKFGNGGRRAVSSKPKMDQTETNKDEKKKKSVKEGSEKDDLMPMSGALEFAKAFLCNTSITSFDISNNYLFANPEGNLPGSPDGCFMLLQSIWRNPYLIRLDLSSNVLAGPGIGKALQYLLEYNQVLQLLQLVSCSLTLHSAEGIGEGLAENVGLTELNLCGNEKLGCGAGIIGWGAPLALSLGILKMCDCDLSNTNAAEMAASLSLNRRPSDQPLHIDISANRWCDDESMLLVKRALRSAVDPDVMAEEKLQREILGFPANSRPGTSRTYLTTLSADTEDKNEYRSSTILSTPRKRGLMNIVSGKRPTSSRSIRDLIGSGSLGDSSLSRPSSVRTTSIVSRPSTVHGTLPQSYSRPVSTRRPRSTRIVRRPRSRPVSTHSHSRPKSTRITHRPRSRPVSTHSRPSSHRLDFNSTGRKGNANSSEGKFGCENEKNGIIEDTREFINEIKEEKNNIDKCISVELALDTHNTNEIQKKEANVHANTSDSETKKKYSSEQKFLSGIPPLSIRKHNSDGNNDLQQSSEQANTEEYDPHKLLLSWKPVVNPSQHCIFYYNSLSKTVQDECPHPGVLVSRTRPDQRFQLLDTNIEDEKAMSMVSFGDKEMREVWATLVKVSQIERDETEWKGWVMMKHNSGVSFYYNKLLDQCDWKPPRVIRIYYRREPNREIAQHKRNMLRNKVERVRKHNNKYRRRLKRQKRELLATQLLYELHWRKKKRHTFRRRQKVDQSLSLARENLTNTISLHSDVEPQFRPNSKESHQRPDSNASFISSKSNKSSDSFGEPIYDQAVIPEELEDFFEAFERPTYMAALKLSNNNIEDAVDLILMELKKVKEQEKIDIDEYKAWKKEKAALARQAEIERKKNERKANIAGMGFTQRLNFLVREKVAIGRAKSKIQASKAKQVLGATKRFKGLRKFSKFGQDKTDFDQEDDIHRFIVNNDEIDKDDVNNDGLWSLPEDMTKESSSPAVFFPEFSFSLKSQHDSFPGSHRPKSREVLRRMGDGIITPLGSRPTSSRIEQRVNNQ